MKRHFTTIAAVLLAAVSWYAYYRDVRVLQRDQETLQRNMQWLRDDRQTLICEFENRLRVTESQLVQYSEQIAALCMDAVEKADLAVDKSTIAANAEMRRRMAKR